MSKNALTDDNKLSSQTENTVIKKIKTGGLNHQPLSFKHCSTLDADG